MTQNDINNTASIMAIDNITIDGNTISSTDTNGNVIIAPDGTGTVSVTTAPIVPTGDRADSLGSATNSWDNVYADGLSFDDGTNVLGSYVEATTFTPALEFGGGSTGITYSQQVGYYSRIGKVVFIHIRLVLTNKGSSSGNTTISGLPYTNIGINPPAACRWSKINLGTNYTSVGPTFNSSSTVVGIGQDGDNVGSGNITNTSFANDSTISVDGFYFTA